MRAPCCSFPLEMANESSPEGGCSQFVGMLRIRFRGAYIPKANLV